MREHIKIRKLIYLAILTAMGLVLSIFESAIPLPVALPGARLGLSNIVVLSVIIKFGYKEGLSLAILKTFLLVLITGNISSFIFSFCGALLSCISMILAHKYLINKLSTIGISLIGSYFHNVGQIIAASIILNSFRIISYLPLLLLLSIFTGYFVGIVSGFLVDNLNKTFKEDV